MTTLIRTAAIYAAAFLAGQVIPKNSVIIPLFITMGVALATLDFFLYARTGRGLSEHIKSN